MKKLFFRSIFFSIPFLLCGLILILIDPFNYFNYSDVIPEDLKVKISKPLNYALWKVIEFERSPEENIFLGDSRVAGLDLNAVKDYSGLKFYDFAYGGGNTREIISTFWFAASLIKLKNVYIGLNFSIYNGFNIRDRVKDALTKLDNPFLYLTNLNTLEAAYYLLRASVLGEKISVEQPDMSKEEFWKFKLKEAVNRYYANYLYPDSFYKELKEISDYCEKNNINLVFMIMPVHTDLQQMVSKYKLTDEYKVYLNDLNSLGPVFNFNIPNEFTTDRENFRDPFHIKNDILSKIMKTMWVN
ncbi:MAG: hypothetical protein Kow0098_01280 [Ignavibacteriaceae bacterium]